MKNLLSWLASVFRVDVVWVEKENGHWAKRRRYHPAAKAALAACILFLGVLWGRSFFVVDRDFRAPETREETETEAQSELSQPPENMAPQLRMTDFTYLSGDAYPVPGDLDVTDDEYWLRVNKGDYKLYLYRGREVEKAYEVAVGRNPGDKERAGDNRTPIGTFTVQSIEDSRSWTYDFRDGKGIIRGAYGPWFIRLRTGWRGIGIHGTHDPNSLGTMVSEGCIRMHNSELEELKQFASVKMKVVIEE